jgi:hypothetical protein
MNLFRLLGEFGPTLADFAELPRDEMLKLDRKMADSCYQGIYPICYPS